MARRRMIDPQFWEDTKVGRLSIPARLLFLGMISLADDEGRGEADASYLRRNVFGFDDFSVDAVQSLRDEVVEKIDGVILYGSETNPLYCLLHWQRWQTINRPKPSNLPPPPGMEEVVKTSSTGEIGAVFQAWENISGTITSFIANEFIALVDDWDAHRKTIPDGMPGKDVSGIEAMLAAIKITGESSSPPHVFKYPKKVMLNWMQYGYMSKPPGAKSNGQKPEPKPVQKTHTKEEIRKAKSQK